MYSKKKLGKTGCQIIRWKKHKGNNREWKSTLDIALKNIKEVSNKTGFTVYKYYQWDFTMLLLFFFHKKGLIPHFHKSYERMISCKILFKLSQWFKDIQSNRQTDKQMNTQTVRQTNQQTEDRQPASRKS